MDKHRNWTGYIIALVTPFIYIATIHPATRGYGFPFALALLALTLTSYLFRKQTYQVLIYSACFFVLTLIGVTGWYFSPFFNWIYLLAIAMSFLFTPIVSILFILVLVALFLPNVGSIDILLDVLVLTSLLLIIPLSYFLRRYYLKLKENEKKILILEAERKNFESTVEEVLANKVTKFAVELREPINDMRQLAYVGKTAKKKSDLEKSMDKIIKLSERALNDLKVFEEGSTGKKLLKTPVK